MDFNSLHPVSDEMRKRICDELAKIEEEHDVTIVYACESGSRAWGFSSTDSDYDVRFIYVEKPHRYISVTEHRDVIEKPIDKLLDISGWSLHKALGLMWKSNPALYEWLASPIVYHQHPETMGPLRDMAPDYFKPEAAWYHYRSLCFNTFDRHLQGDSIRLKKYFYALRPILAACWVLDKGTIPPMVFHELAQGIVDAELVAEIDMLLDKKRVSTEITHIPSNTVIKDFIEEFLSIEKPDFTKIRLGQLSKLDAFLFEQVNHYA